MTNHSENKPSNAKVFSPDEACRLAQNLARNASYACFPVRLDKTPATPHGCRDASTDPEVIARLFRRHPGPLIGIATGKPSGISVLDVDIKHPEARIWWRQNEDRIPCTRTYRTRRAGFHCYFRHVPGIRNAQARPVPGIDVRGQGGYVVAWFATGHECLDHSPPATWPAWLTTAIWPPASAQPVQSAAHTPPPSGDQADRIITRAIQRVRSAPDGAKHSTLRDAALLLGGIQARAAFSDAEAIRWLLQALPSAETGIRPPAPQNGA